MNIENTKLTNISDINSSKGTEQEKQMQEYKYHGELDPNSGALILSSDRTGWFDAQRTFYINKDGSGRYLTAWGSRDYPKNTFDDVIKNAKNILENKASKTFADSDIEQLIKQFEICMYKK